MDHITSLSPNASWREEFFSSQDYTIIAASPPIWNFFARSFRFQQVTPWNIQTVSFCHISSIQKEIQSLSLFLNVWAIGHWWIIDFLQHLSLSIVSHLSLLSVQLVLFGLNKPFVVLLWVPLFLWLFCHEKHPQRVSVIYCSVNKCQSLGALQEWCAGSLPGQTH